MTDESKADNGELPSILKRAVEANKYIVGVTVLCYVTGFAISNIYLGSLGVLNLDVLRVRYILIGFLFLTFALTIAYPLYSLFPLIRDNHDKPILSLLGRVTISTLDRYGLTAILVIALASISSFTSLPVGIPQITQPPSWGDWIDKEAVNSLVFTAGYLSRVFIVVASILAVIFVAVIVINPKTGEGKKIVRREWFKEIIRWSVKSLITRNVLLFIFALIFIGEIGGLIDFIGKSRTQTNISFSNAWWRFFAASVLIYTFITAFVILIIRLPRSEEQRIDPSRRPIGKSASLLMAALIVSWIVLPVYALGVYPLLPQQVGGGQVVPIEITSTDPDVNQMISTTSVNLYLVDRTSDSVILLAINKKSQDFTLVEVPKSQLNSIKYTTRQP